MNQEVDLEKKWVAGTPRVYMRLPVPLVFCPGCNHGLVIKMLCDVIGELGIEGRTVGINAATCGASSCVLVGVDWVFGAHGRPADIATAIKRVSRGNLILVTYQGDGDCFAIGTEGTIHAAIRGERITVLMVNNQNYGTTGGQMSPTTLVGWKTTTTPYGRDPKRDGYPALVPELLANIKGVAYSARGAVNNPANYQKSKKYIKTALQKQVDDIGFSFVEIISACPPDWHLTPLECLKRIEEEIIPQMPLGEFKNVDRID